MHYYSITKFNQYVISVQATIPDLSAGKCNLHYVIITNTSKYVLCNHI